MINNHYNCPVESVESQEYFQSLGRTEHGHAELLSEKGYQTSKDILLGKGSSMIL